MKTKQEIIVLFEGILSVYKKDVSKRGIDTTAGCVYLTSNGNMCAIGQCMTEEGIKKYGDYVGDVEDVVGQLGTELNLDSILQDKYRDIPTHLWSELQRIHDTTLFWSPHGITEAGQDAIKVLYKNLN